jgi:Cohesin domain
MKKILVILLAVFMVIAPVKTFAASNASVEVNVSGEVKKGSNIEILVDVKNVDNLYAASIDFTYNTNQLEVESIKPTEYITKNIDNIMELGGETNKNGDTATYSFTFLGDVDVLMESGTLVKINAKVLNNDKLSITKENMKIKLIQKADGTVKNYDYKFIGYNGQDDSNSNLSNDSNTGSSNNNVGSNGTSNEKNDNSQGSDNKKVSSNNSNNSTNNGNEVSKDENLNKNNDENNSNGESSSNSKDNKENKDKNSNSNDSKIEVSKNNIANVAYVLIAIGVVGGVGYYYYKFRKNKNKNN